MSMNNPIGKLQELHQRDLTDLPPMYNLIESKGEAHGPTFTIEASFKGLLAVAEGSSKKQAKTLAASKLLSLLDSGISPKIVPPIPEPESTGNKVGELQEYCAVKGLLSPWYEELAAVGPAHMKNFTLICKLGWISETGEGTTKKSAKREGANKVLLKLQSLTPEQLLELENPDVKKRIKEFEESGGVGEGGDGTVEGGEGGDSAEGFIGVWTGEEIQEMSVSHERSNGFNKLDLSEEPS